MQIPCNSEASRTWMGGAALRMRQQHCQLLRHPPRPYVSLNLLREPSNPRTVSMTELTHFNAHPLTLHVTMTIPIIPSVVPQDANLSSGMGSFARTCGFDALVFLMLRLTLAVQVAGGGNTTGGMLAAEFQEVLTTDGCGCFAKAPMCPASRLLPACETTPDGDRLRAPCTLFRSISPGGTSGVISKTNGLMSMAQYTQNHSQNHYQDHG